MKRSISRRTFLKTAGIGAGAMALAACGAIRQPPKPQRLARAASRKAPGAASTGALTYWTPFTANVVGHAEGLQRDDLLPGIGKDYRR